MKKISLFLFLLSLNAVNIIFASQNNPLDDAVAWLFSSQNPANQQNSQLYDQYNELLKTPTDDDDEYNYPLPQDNPQVPYIHFQTYNSSTHSSAHNSPTINIISEETSSDGQASSGQTSPIHHGSSNLVRVVTLETLQANAYDAYVASLFSSQNENAQPYQYYVAPKPSSKAVYKRS